MDLVPVIGLEVHAQLKTESKIFCGCSTQFGSVPNDNTCPVCLGLPGALPVFNEKALHLALLAAVAFHCEIPPSSVFARKNYFYPDLPKGYQISQYDRPLAVNGYLEIITHGSLRKIRLTRIHLEEDAGKLLHEVESGASLVDLNRSGIPLIEIVSEPDIESPEEAYAYLNLLKATLQYCGISDANMEEGNLRCDCNISLHAASDRRLGTRVEIKNLNSFRNVVRALEHEIDRQKSVLEAGGKVVQETRLFDADRGVTEPMRTKEEAHDYRYFPEPDLLSIQITRELVQQVSASLPELPAAKLNRLMREYPLTFSEASILVEETTLADFFEQTAKSSKEPKQSVNWILRDLLEKLKESRLAVSESPVGPEQLAEMISLIQKGIISHNQGKEVFQQMWQTRKSPAQIIQEKGMVQISKEEELNRIIEQVFAENPDIVKRYKNGEMKLQGVLVGLVMKASGGKANPGIVNRLLKEQLE